MSEVNEMTTVEQMSSWKKELALAMDDQQWQRAIQLCSWLRYALWKQESADQEVDEAQGRAKEGLAEQMAQEKKRQRRQDEYRRRRDRIMHKVANSQPKDALASIEGFYQDGANSQDVIHLLQELKMRFSRMLGSNYRQNDLQAEAFGRRVDDLDDRARSKRK